MNDNSRFSKSKDILENLFIRLDRFVGQANHLEDDASMVVLKVHEDLNFPGKNDSTD